MDDRKHTTVPRKVSKHDPAASYRTLSREDFDAIVTGELTHVAVWLELELETAIENYFAVRSDTREAFSRLILQREGMAFQTKIDIVRIIVSGNEFKQEYKDQWKGVLLRIEEIKRVRNAMAHGKDVGGQGLTIKVGYISRSGKETEIEIEPNSHAARMAEAEKLQDDLHELVAGIQDARIVPTASDRRGPSKG